MTTKHTLGPWRICLSEQRIVGPKSAEPSPTTIATWKANPRMTVDEERANATLIAAAPDLLATLMAIKQRINGQFDEPELMAMGSMREEQDADILAWARAAIDRAMSR